MRSVAVSLTGLLVAGVLVVTTEAPAAADSEVLIDPAAGLTAEQESEIRALVAGADDPITVVAVGELPPEARRSTRLHAEQVLAGLDDPGPCCDNIVLVFSPEALPPFGAATDSFDIQTSDALRTLDHMEGADTDKFVALVDMVRHRQGNEALAAALERRREEMQERLSSQGSRRQAEQPDAGIRTVRWVALGLGAVLLGAFVFFRGRAVADWWRRRTRAAGIQGAADSATQLNLADQAHADLLAFGAAIEAQPMRADHALELWHLALDDYDAATRLHDTPHGDRQDKKIIEICARGRDRLARAAR